MLVTSRLLLVVFTGPLLMLAGCTVPQGAVAAISVNAKGEPVGVIQVCRERIDGATLYRSDNDKLGSWTSSPPATGTTTWPLAQGGNGWTVSDPLVKLRPGLTYALYGWTNDNSSSASVVEFSTDDLARLRPGEVRYQSGEVSDSSDGYKTATLAEFQAVACSLGG